LTKTLVANLLVPDNEVWVSPLTFAERTAEDRGTQPTTGNSAMDEIADEMDTVLMRLNKPHGEIDWPFVINGWRRRLRQ
jgi:hypothetical protein